MSKDVRPFSNAEYTVIVLQCLKRAAKRSNWLSDSVIPRSIDHDTADSHEVVEALEHAIHAVRAQRSSNEE